MTRVERLGDAALLVTLGDELDLALNARALRLADALDAMRGSLPGLGAAVPGHAAVLVPFDPDVADETAVRGAIAAAEASAGVGWLRTNDDRSGAASSVLHRIPVRYGGADGPDLEDVASATGLTPDEVVALHAGVEHRVLVLGFLPGFAYLGGLPAVLELPRRQVPRLRVPAGSVAIAGQQTGIYPFASPGGWHCIGRADAVLWDPGADPPALLAQGDRVRFVPV